MRGSGQERIKEKRRVEEERKAEEGKERKGKERNGVYTSQILENNKITKSRNVLLEVTCISSGWRRSYFIYLQKIIVDN